MKIYVITKGCYSDYHICAVATDKEKANMLAKKFSDSYECAEIEEYDTDDCNEVLKWENSYSCFYFEKDNRISVHECDFDRHYKSDYTPTKTRDGYYVAVYANDKEEALKKASDIFAKVRAEENDL